MNNIKYKLQRFFRNRYGADPLGLAFVGTSLILSILASITRIGFFSIVSMIIMAYEIYRMFSKNYVKRRIENDHYMEYKTIVQRRWKVIRNSLQDRNNHYYMCPKCHQIVRVPKGRGKIEITCPSCRNKFVKKS